MSAVTLRPGDLVVVDPSEKRVVTFDWDAASLAAAVTISTSTFTLTAVRQNGLTAVTVDNPTMLTGSRKTSVRVDATTGTLGDEYALANKIVTSETPAQTKELSIRVLVQDR